jgi:hypothetical protein
MVSLATTTEFESAYATDQPVESVNPLDWTACRADWPVELDSLLDWTAC